MTRTEFTLDEIKEKIVATFRKQVNGFCDEMATKMDFNSISQLVNCHKIKLMEFFDVVYNASTKSHDEIGLNATVAVFQLACIQEALVQALNATGESWPDHEGVGDS